MRFLIVATAVLACAAAVPSGLLAAPYHAGYGAPLVHGTPLVHAAPLVHTALPTISPGDLAAASIDAHVEQSDHVRASVDAHRELHDQASELQGQAINAAEDHSWQAVDAAKTAQAQLDGAAAGVAPVLAKQLVGHGAYAAPAAYHGAYAAPAIHGAYAAPAIHGAYAAPAIHGAYAAPAIHGAYAAPAIHGAYVAPAIHGAYAAPALGHAAYAAPAYAASKTVVSQSLSQSHPSALIHSSPLVHTAPAYAGYGHAW